jgi:hypothetical protein
MEVSGSGIRWQVKEVNEWNVSDGGSERIVTSGTRAVQIT